MNAAALAGQVRDALRRALTTFPVRSRLETALAPFRGIDVDVLAVGKAADTMIHVMAGAEGISIGQALVIAPRGTKPLAPGPWSRIESDHPLPTSASIDAADRAIELVTAGTRPLVVLLSGGASALVAKPAPGITLEEKRAVTSELLSNGAPIASINVVRRHLSLVKGGGLALAAAPRSVTTLVLSDVVTGGVHDVGSGLTVPDPTSADEARAVLRQFAPAFAGLPLRATLSPFDVRARSLATTVVGTPQDFAFHVASELEGLGLAVSVLDGSVAPAEEVTERWARRFAALAPGHALLAPGECPVRVTSGAGRGGRASHLAALVLQRLPASCVFAAVASDGRDGASDAAGAIVGPLSRARLDGPRAERDALHLAIEERATADYFARRGEAFVTGPTGLNFADVHVLARA